MHDINDPANSIDQNLAESSSLLGKECVSCFRAFPYNLFQRDSSYKDGRRDQCQYCENAPRLSTEEHVARLKELNYNSCAVKAQRFDHQEDYEDALARMGRPMHHRELYTKLKKLNPDLYLTDGNLVDCMSLFRTYPCAQPRLDGRDFEYLFYIPEGYMPEYSIYEFDERDIPVKERMRGWRTVLLRLIKSEIITEMQCTREFGEPIGPASIVWRRKLYIYRNQQ